MIDIASKLIAICQDHHAEPSESAARGRSFDSADPRFGFQPRARATLAAVPSPGMPLWLELLMVLALLFTAPLAILFARYRLWRARFAAGRTTRGFLDTEIRWRFPFIVVGLLMAVAAFAAVMLSAPR